MCRSGKDVHTAFTGDAGHQRYSLFAVVSCPLGFDGRLRLGIYWEVIWRKLERREKTVLFG
jgi:hypothetical protein